MRRPPDIGHCTCCGRKLDPTKIVWLELDQRTGEYHDFGGIPDDLNQGAFEFGPGCAKKARAKAARRGMYTTKEN